MGGVESLAYRIAILLESDPRLVLDANKLVELAREYLGGSAGHGREMYDAAEAGVNILLARTGLEIGNIPESLRLLLAV